MNITLMLNLKIMISVRLFGQIYNQKPLKI